MAPCRLTFAMSSYSLRDDSSLSKEISADSISTISLDTCRACWIDGWMHVLITNGDRCYERKKERERQKRKRERESVIKADVLQRSSQSAHVHWPVDVDEHTR